MLPILRVLTLKINLHCKQASALIFIVLGGAGHLMPSRAADNILPSFLIGISQIPTPKQLLPCQPGHYGHLLMAVQTPQQLQGTITALLSGGLALVVTTSDNLSLSGKIST